MTSTRRILLVLFFVANTAFLCATSAFYSLDCIHYEQHCTQAAKLIAVIFAVATVFYGVSCLVSMIYFGRHHFDDRGSLCFINLLMSLTSASFIFSVVAGTGMLISLFFSFDPSSLEKGYREIHFVLMWVLAAYAAVSNGLLFAMTLLISFRYNRENPKVLTPKIFVIPPDSSSDSHKTPIV